MIEFLDLTSGLAGGSDHALPIPAVMATEDQERRCQMNKDRRGWTAWEN
jgi:hypothetical protein